MKSICTVMVLLAQSCLTSPATGAQDDTATLTIHNRECPIEYPGTDFYDRCHDTPIAGMDYFVDGPVSEQDTTDDHGNVTFTNLPPGTYEVSGGPSGDVMRNTIFCASAAAVETPVPALQTATTRLVLDLAPGNQIICDWYSVPELRGIDPNATPDTANDDRVDETLTVIGTICPQGYQGSDYVADCSAIPAAGASYRVERIPGFTAIPAVGFFTANDSGVLTFSLGSLAPGTISLLATIPVGVPIPGGFTVPEVRCFIRDGEEVHDVALVESRFTGQIIRIFVGLGEHPHCNVYFLPLAPTR